MHANTFSQNKFSGTPACLQGVMVRGVCDANKTSKQLCESQEKTSLHLHESRVKPENSCINNE